MGEPALRTAPPRPAAETRRAGAPPRVRVETDKLTAMYGKFTAVKGVSLSFTANRVHALIGPSGCGKSTFLRTLNRMHELSEHGWITGRVLLDGEDIYAPAGERDAAPPPHRDGVPAADAVPHDVDLRQRGRRAPGARATARKAELDAIVERSLRQAALWDEVKDRLARAPWRSRAGSSSGSASRGPSRRSPEVVLLDEPTASLDPQGTQRIEELVFELKRDFTIIIVTHNMQQAARVSDTTAFFYLGAMVETGPTRQIFTAPRNEQTEAYITGRFG